jgi:hypothetical protein
MDNWAQSDDTNLYLYATKDTHSLEVNEELFTVTYDAESNTFTVTPGTPQPQVGAPKSGDLDGDGTTASDALRVARAVISGTSGLTDAQILAADMDEDGYLTMADVVRILRKAAGLS